MIRWSRAVTALRKDSPPWWNLDGTKYFEHINMSRFAVVIVSLWLLMLLMMIINYCYDMLWCYDNSSSFLPYDHYFHHEPSSITSAPQIDVSASPPREAWRPQQQRRNVGEARRSWAIAWVSALRVLHWCRRHRTGIWWSTGLESNFLKPEGTMGHGPRSKAIKTGTLFVKNVKKWYINKPPISK